VWTGWLEDFRRWVTPTTDACEESIYAAGLLALSCAIGRSVSVNYAGVLYSNLYVVIVGPTSVSRKTTVLRRARSVLQRAFTQDWLRWARSVGSAEGLLERFCRESEAGSGKSKQLVFAPIPGQRLILDESEFTGLFVKMSRPATANLLEVFLTLYDGEDYKPHTRSRPMEIQQPFFSILSATTPTMLEKRIDDIHLTSGLLPRFAFFQATPRTPIAYPELSSAEGLEQLALGLQRLSLYAQELSQSLELTPDARQAWEPVYISFQEEQRTIEGIGADLLSRMTALAMKVALIYAVMQGHRSIFEEDLHAGVSVARYCSDVALEMPLTRLDTSRAARLDEKILGTLNGVPTFASTIHEQLSGRIGAEELRRELTNLVGLGLLEEEKVILRGRERMMYTKVHR
jgi:hypothetical protein